MDGRHRTPPPPAALQALRAQLRRLRRRLRRRLLAGGLAHLLWALVLAAAVSFAADHTLELERGGRLLLDLLLALAVVAVAWRRLLAPLLRWPGDLALAGLVEARGPERHSLLSSAIAFAHRPDPGADPAAIEATLQAAETLAREDRHLTARLLRPGTLRRRLGAGLLALLLVGVTLWSYPGLARVWMERNLLLADTPWPRPTTLVLLEADATGTLVVPHGDPLVVAVQAVGRLPEQVWLEVSFADGARRRLALTAGESGRFWTELESVLEPGTLTASSRRAHPAHGRIQVIPRPELLSLTVTVRSPPYMDLPVRRELAPTLLQVPEGTELGVAGEATKPLRRAWIVTGEEAVALASPGGDTFAGTLVPAPASETLVLHLEDRDGLDQSRPHTIDLEVTPDLPPDMELTPLGVGVAITPIAQIRYRVRATDDHGLAGGELTLERLRAEEEEARTAPLPEELEVGVGVYEAVGLLEVAALEVQPGDLLRVRAQARDRRDADHGGPGIGTSETYAFKVVTAEELMVELFRQQLELRREFQRAIADQEVIVEELDTGTEDPDGLERLERSVARRLEGFAERFTAILSELETNQIARPDDRQRIEHGIVRPLEATAAGPLREAAEQISEDPTAAAAAARTGLEQLRQILEQMIEQETYAQILAQLREVIRLHTTAGDAATEERRRKILEIFEDE